MKKVYMREQNYLELDFFGCMRGKKYNYKKLYKKGDKIICRKYAFEIGNELNENGVLKVEKKILEDVAVVKRN